MATKKSKEKVGPAKTGGGLYIVPAVKKAFMIVEMMASDNHGYRLSEVARQCKLPVSTANVLLHTLQECGYLERDEHGAFSLRLKLFTEGNKLIRQVELYDASFAELQRLSRLTDFSINLAVPDVYELIYMRLIQGRGDIQVQAHVGQRRHFHQAATGKAMMAFFTDERTKEFASATGLPSVTNRTITTYRALLKELEQVRVQGYAIDVEESGHLLWGVAAPIFDHNGDVVAAVGVSGTVISLKQNADFLIQEVCKSALEISKCLGYEQPSRARIATVPWRRSDESLRAANSK
jgi:DNA-binding IclR family transcriptional regulator